MKTEKPFRQIVTAVPMQGPIPFEAAYVVRRGKSVMVDRELAKLCKARANRGPPEYQAAQGLGLSVHNTLEDALAALGWESRINGKSHPVLVWECSDTGRFQIGY